MDDGSRGGGPGTDKDSNLETDFLSEPALSHTLSTEKDGCVGGWTDGWMRRRQT